MNICFLYNIICDAFKNVTFTIKHNVIVLLITCSSDRRKCVYDYISVVRVHTREQRFAGYNNLLFFVESCRSVDDKRF